MEAVTHEAPTVASSSLKHSYLAYETAPGPGCPPTNGAQSQELHAQSALETHDGSEITRDNAPLLLSVKGPSRLTEKTAFMAALVWLMAHSWRRPHHDALRVFSSAYRAST